MYFKIKYKMINIKLPAFRNYRINLEYIKYKMLNIKLPAFRNYRINL